MTAVQKLCQKQWRSFSFCPVRIVQKSTLLLSKWTKMFQNLPKDTKMMVSHVFCIAMNAKIR